jgi:hypothetical protein
LASALREGYEYLERMLRSWVGLGTRGCVEYPERMLKRWVGLLSRGMVITWRGSRRGVGLWTSGRAVSAWKGFRRGF